MISTMPSLCSNLDTVAPLKKKVIKQRRLAPWYDSQIRALKQTSRKLERECNSRNFEDFHLAWKESLKMYEKALGNAKSSCYSVVIEKKQEQAQVSL